MTTPTLPQHPAQQTILRTLLFRQSSEFRELCRPTKLSSAHVAFHINQLMARGLIERDTAGHYVLSTPGKLMAGSLRHGRGASAVTPVVSLLIVVRRGVEGAHEYLMQERLKQPFYGRIGSMSGVMHTAESPLVAASRELSDKTGLSGDPRLAAMFHKLNVAPDGTVLEDIHFYLIFVDNPQGRLKKQCEGGRNHWLSRDEIRALSTAYPSVIDVLDHAEMPQFHYWEHTYHYEPGAY